MLFNCGGILTLDWLETVLRTMFSELEKTTGQAAPSTLRTVVQRFSQRKSPPTAKKIYEADLELEARKTILRMTRRLNQRTLIPEESVLEENDSESEAQVTEAFLASWRAKQKTEGVRRVPGTTVNVRD